MFLLDPTTTEPYLRDRGELDANETVCVSELSGGVSNQVLLVERSRGDRFVLARGVLVGERAGRLASNLEDFT